MIFSSSLASASLVQMKAVSPRIICVKNPVTQQDRVDIAITPEFVEHDIVREAGSTIEEERVECASVLDVIAEGLKHISQLCAITEEVYEEVFLHCADSELCKVHRALQWHGLHRLTRGVCHKSPAIHRETHSS